MKRATIRRTIRMKRDHDANISFCAASGSVRGLEKYRDVAHGCSRLAYRQAHPHQKHLVLLKIR